jgi:hypothetical protein
MEGRVWKTREAYAYPSASVKDMERAAWKRDRKVLIPLGM